MEHESLKDLLLSIPHWKFEVITTIVFYGITYLAVTPLLNRWKKHHKEDDTKLEDLQRQIDALNKVKKLSVVQDRVRKIK